MASPNRYSPEVFDCSYRIWQRGHQQGSTLEIGPLCLVHRLVFVKYTRRTVGWWASAGLLTCQDGA